MLLDGTAKIEAPAPIGLITPIHTITSVKMLLTVVIEQANNPDIRVEFDSRRPDEAFDFASTYSMLKSGANLQEAITDSIVMQKAFMKWLHAKYPEHEYFVVSKTADMSVAIYEGALTKDDLNHDRGATILYPQEAYEVGIWAPRRVKA